MRQYFKLSLIIFVLMFSTASYADAQTPNLPQAINNVTLVPSPKFPEPGELTYIELNDYSINSSGATIRWFIDGVEDVSMKNKRSIQTYASDLGVKKVVTAILTMPTGIQIQTDYTMKPVRIDTIVEADTLTPAFYKGRALPSNGSIVHITALPFTIDGAPPSSFSYVWKINGKVQNGGELYGENTFSYVPKFENEVLVSVDVIDAGTIISSESIYVPIQEPELYFYEINPLRGMSTNAIKSPHIFVGDEIIVRAEPYYISANLLREQPFTEWKLDGQIIDNQNSDTQEIVLRKNGPSGRFTISFHIRNLKQLLQGVKDSFTIQF